MVSIVILTWNRKDDLIETVTELRKSSYAPMEVIVVDNSSADGTPAVIKEKFPDVIFIRLEKNIGIGGYNIGMKKARGEYVVLLDSDSFPDRKAIERMVAVFESDKKVGAVAFDVHNSRFKIQDSRFKNLQLESCNLQPFDLKKCRDVYGYNGAGVGIRKECLERAGYLFEPYFLYFNEQDHAFRILQAGYKIKFHPDIVAYHKTSMTSRVSRSVPYFYTRNLLWLIWRFYPIRYAFVSTISLFFYASLSTIQQRTSIYMKAILDAILGFSMVLSNRFLVDRNIIKNVRIPIRWAFMAYK
ncbi:MAG: glycosyltransferase family 2 protein [Nitrospinae bacterium]|nr:glycosyltransferase family 2 protein [Nitrospinota bacterium]